MLKFYLVADIQYHNNAHVFFGAVDFIQIIFKVSKAI